MIRLDFHINFKREGGEMNSAKERGLRTMEAGTGPNNMLFIFILLYRVFLTRYCERRSTFGRMDRRKNCSILFKAALIFKKLYFEVSDGRFL